MFTPKEALKNYFGYNNFRPKQAEIVDAALRGLDCFVLMPTGGGKSICFQIPAMLLPGITLVVSPLISLMKDQVEGLKESGIPAAALNSNQSAEENLRIQHLALQGQLKLLYMSPEMMLSGLGQWISELDVSLIAVDEAHCISQWGHDFRPEYTQLGIVRRQLPHVPIMALTATADKLTREDILTKLCLHNPFVSVSSFDRPNLDLAVIKGFTGAEKLKAIKRFIEEHPQQSGIIYCLARKTTEKVAAQLQKYGIKALAYHAALSPALRDEVQRYFIQDKIQIVVATVAFGMGIDKSNVRWVVHYNLPKSIESYYQEIGRAGRDGESADTLLFYGYGDIVQLESFAQDSGQSEINLERLNRMKEYAEAQVCRRKILLNYFGESTTHDCGHCDVCRNPPKRFDGSIYTQKALSAIMRTDQKVNLKTLIDILMGTYSKNVCEHGYEHIKTFGAGRDTTRRYWQDYLLQMLQQGLIEVVYNEQNRLRVTPLGKEVLYGKCSVDLAEPQQIDFTQKSKKAKKDKNIQFFSPEYGVNGIDDETMFERLKALRWRLATEQGLPPYIIFNDRTLHEITRMRPSTLDELEQVSGIGQNKKEKYGAALLSVLNES